MSQSKDSGAGTGGKGSGKGGKGKGEREVAIHVREVCVEAPEKLKELVISSASSSLKKMAHGELKTQHECAKFVRDAVCEQYPGNWHVIVGEGFGSFVTYEAQRVVYVFLGQVGFLVFKHG